MIQYLVPSLLSPSIRSTFLFQRIRCFVLTLLLLRSSLGKFLLPSLLLLGTPLSFFPFSLLTSSDPRSETEIGREEERIRSSEYDAHISGEGSFGFFYS